MQNGKATLQNSKSRKMMHPGACRIFAAQCVFESALCLIQPIKDCKFIYSFDSMRLEAGAGAGAGLGMASSATQVP